MISVLEIMERDHRRIGDLFDRLVEMPAHEQARERETLFLELAAELDSHIRAEEAIVYPKIEAIDETEKLAERSRDEHEQLKESIETVRRLPPQDDQWVRRLGELRDRVRHHVKQEERLVFRRVRELFTVSELKEMAVAYREARKQFAQAS